MKVQQLYYNYIKDNVDEFKTFLLNTLSIDRLKDMNKNILTTINNEEIKKIVIHMLDYLNVLINNDIVHCYNLWLESKTTIYVKTYLEDMKNTDSITNNLENKRLKGLTKKIVKQKMNEDYKQSRNEISIALESILTIHRDRLNVIKGKDIITKEDVDKFLYQIDNLLWFHNVLTFLTYTFKNKIFILTKFRIEEKQRNFISILNKILETNHEIDWWDAYGYLYEMFIILTEGEDNE